MKDGLVTVYGPIAPIGQGTVIYSVTLANGSVISSPQGFGTEEKDEPAYSPRPLPGQSV